MNNKHFEQYKKNIISENKETINNYLQLRRRKGIDDEFIEKKKPKLYEQYQNITNLLKDNNMLTQNFFKDVYTRYIPMKMPKTNFNISKLGNLEDSYTPSAYYEYIRQISKFGKQKIIGFDTNNRIDKIFRLSKDKATKEDKELLVINNEMYKGAKLLYLVSVKDALLGCNWSNELQKDEALRENPLRRLKPVPSAYGAKTGEKPITDSIGLPYYILKPITFNASNISLPSKAVNISLPRKTVTSKQNNKSKGKKSKSNNSNVTCLLEDGS